MAGDIEGVVADHSKALVIFDVPPRAAVFVEWRPVVRRGHRSSSGGSTFEIDSLNGTSGSDAMSHMPNA